MTPYEEFLRSKMVTAPERGIAVDPQKIHPWLKPHAAAIVRWALRRGNAGIFAAFGLHKTSIQLEIARHISRHTGEPFLITAPLGVRQEFRRDAVKLDLDLTFIRETKEAKFGAPHVYVTNYESVREGKIDPRNFAGASLDEASVLRGFGGTKTFREFMRVYEHGQVQYKFVATATPDPNEYIELLAYAAFLDVMDVSQAKTRFFKRDSTKADHLTLHPHKEREFWLWVSTWAIFLQKPSDLGFSDEGYNLPEMEVRWHELPSDHTTAGHETSGQGRLVRSTAVGVTHAAKEKRESLSARVQKLMELRALDPTAHRIVWHDLESERAALEKTGMTTVYGKMPLDQREQIIVDFSDGTLAELGAKPVLAGSGCNFQYHCAWEIFLGIGFKFNDFIQAIHRCYRFQQTKAVRLDLIYTEAEREVRRILEEKWERHKAQVEKMSAIIREYGLAANALEAEFGRSLGVERQEASGENWRMVLNDSVVEAASLPDASAHLILTSIPFSTQYEYSPSYNDFGHTETNEQFWEQMGFLLPELHRILQPGRVAAIHVKDRIVPGGLNGMGFQTAYPFHCDAIRHFCRAGFGYMGMVTIVTDVVRENNQTYRLGWTEQCKDGTKMGVGMPEYLLLFRRPPSDSTRGYADLPVIKSKAEYSRHRWQIDAHGFHRSSGDRLLTADDIRNMPHERIFKLFRRHSLENVYDFEEHVKLGEALEVCAHCGHIHLGVAGDDDEGKVCGRPFSEAEHLQMSRLETCQCPRYDSALPKKFMLLQPQSWAPDVWTDITRMLSLNSAQAASGREMHLCPMQFDIADRAIAQYTMPGETVFDPFAGLGTVPMRAIKLGRKGLGVELCERYFRDACYWCETAERQRATPTLFDLIGEPPEAKPDESGDPAENPQPAVVLDGSDIR